jgi:hypothetical protein
VRGPLDQRDHQDIQNQVKPAAIAKQLSVGQFQQLGIHVAGDQQHQQHTDGQAIKVIEPQYTAALNTAER